MESRPLAKQLAIWARIDELVASDTGEVIGGDIANQLPLVWIACISTLPARL
jgi:hypothetical protein